MYFLLRQCLFRFSFFLIFFVTIFLQAPRTTRGLQSKWRFLCWYVGKITVKPRLEWVKIVMIGEASPWESVPHSNVAREETVRGHDGGLLLCMWLGESLSWNFGLAAAANVVRPNTFLGSKGKAARSLSHIACRGAVQCQRIIRHLQGVGDVFREACSNPALGSSVSWKVRG